MGQQESTPHGAGGADAAPRPYPQPGLMKSWVMSKPGDVDAIAVVDAVGIPTPAAGQVRVRVMAAGLGHSDIVRVKVAGMAFPAAVGLDGAGVIDAVGADCPPELAVGARVYFMCNARLPYGSLAEYTLVGVNGVHPIPDQLDFPVAASLPTSAWAAYYALHAKLRVQKGRTIYITGGAGGVGGFAVDLARNAGLTVVTSCSSYNSDYAKERGAQYVLDYTSDDVARELTAIVGAQGVDYILDTASADAEELAALLKLLAPTGELCCLTAIPVANALTADTNQSVHYVNIQGIVHGGAPAETRSWLAASICNLAASGQLKPHVGEIGDFNRALGALKTLETRHARGKLVINVELVHAKRKRMEGGSSDVQAAAAPAADVRGADAADAAAAPQEVPDNTPAAPAPAEASAPPQAAAPTTPAVPPQVQAPAAPVPAPAPAVAAAPEPQPVVTAVPAPAPAPTPQAAAPATAAPTQAQPAAAAVAAPPAAPAVAAPPQPAAAPAAAPVAVAPVAQVAAPSAVQPPPPQQPAAAAAAGHNITIQKRAGQV